MELLKQRFGEESLHKCEVMLKDIKSSDRCSINIDAKLNPDSSEHDPEADSGLDTCPTSVVKPMIISQVFWPPLPGGGAVAAKQEKMKFPPAMTRAMESYSKLCVAPDIAATRIPRDHNQIFATDRIVDQLVLQRVGTIRSTSLASYSGRRRSVR